MLDDCTPLVRGSAGASYIAQREGAQGSQSATTETHDDDGTEAGGQGGGEMQMQSQREAGPGSAVPREVEGREGKGTEKTEGGEGFLEWHAATDRCDHQGAKEEGDGKECVAAQ